MNNINKILIYLIFGLLIYIIYKYQTRIKILLGLEEEEEEEEEHKRLEERKEKRSKEKKGKKENKVYNEEEEILTENISHISLGSLEDAKSFDIKKMAEMNNTEGTIETLVSESETISSINEA